MDYGYIRVSSRDQNEQRQLIAMQALKLPKKRIFMDKQSGKDFDRPAYKALIARLRDGDTLFVASIDRLGRSYSEIQRQWRIISKDKGADIVVLDMPLLDTRLHKDLLGTFISDTVLAILSFVAESERDNIKKRQAEGIAAAKARGVHFGREAVAVPENFAKLIKAWERHEISFAELLKKAEMTRTTFYRRLREYRLVTGRINQPNSP